jgi:MinD-like ATPase involved in chromosome partitioning or flagellar assembly
VTNEATIALVFTPEPWVEQLHRHCTDHGGARVRQVLIDPALALEEYYDVLVVSHRWPALTLGLVDDLHARGRLVLGVYDREEPAGRELLLSVGVDGFVASDAGSAGIVAALRTLHGDGANDASRRRVERDATDVVGASITVVSGPRGAGATEIAVALASSGAAGPAGATPVLVDADDVAPSVAARLGLAIEPNLRSAVEAVEYDGGDLASHLDDRTNGLRVLAGLPSAAGWAQVRPPEVLRLLRRLARDASRVVVDVSGDLEDVPVAMARPRHAIARACIGDADEIVAVGGANPVGVVRLLAWIGDARALAPRAPLHVVVNRAPKDAFRRGEVIDEIAAAHAVTSVTVVPDDRRVGVAAWAGTPVARGPFTRAVAQLGAHLAIASAPANDVAMRVAS